MLKNACAPVDPSSAAASYKWPGISWSAARNMTIKVGMVLKIAMNMIAIQATLGPLRNGEVMVMPSGPNRIWNKPRASCSQAMLVPKTALIQPVGRNSHQKIIDITTEDATLGA